MSQVTPTAGSGNPRTDGGREEEETEEEEGGKKKEKSTTLELRTLRYPLVQKAVLTQISGERGNMKKRRKTKNFKRYQRKQADQGIPSNSQ
jgi:hypothetical protein